MTNVVGSSSAGESSGAGDYKQLVEQYLKVQVKSKVGPAAKENKKSSLFFSVSLITCLDS